MKRPSYGVGQGRLTLLHHPEELKKGYRSGFSIATCDPKEDVYVFPFYR
jgi:hypothetical protein